MIETCEQCDGPLALLGTLGRTTHCTCINCGWHQVIGPNDDDLLLGCDPEDDGEDDDLVLALA